MRWIILPTAALVSATMLLAACSQQTAGPEPDNDPATTTSQAPLPTSDTSGSPSDRTCLGEAGTPCENSTEFCKEPDGQCRTTFDGQGICTKKPEICTEQYDPVCGCDGKTYGNACNAAGAGVSIAAKGECTAPAG